MAFTLRQLRYFLAAAESGSVSGAAQVLAISQSAVTEAIRDLEADLGVQLFERHPRGLNITPRGHQFLRHAQTILGTVSDAQQAMTHEATALSGALNIGVTSLVAGYVISDILSRFRRANPAVEVAALEDTGEYLYSIDRMFWNLKRSGKLKQLHGLVVGGFRIKKDDEGEEFGKTLENIVMEKVAEYDYPVCFDFPVGHQRNNYALACGCPHSLNISSTGTTLIQE